MKLSKIKKALKRKTLAIVTESGGNQWLGDGVAFYLVDSGLDLTADNVKAILDIDEDKRDEYTVRMLEDTALPMCDMCPQEGNDEELHPLVSVSWAGELVTIMRTEDGKRSFKVTLAPPEGSSYARDIAEKYGVTYDMLIGGA